MSNAPPIVVRVPEYSDQVHATCTGRGCDWTITGPTIEAIRARVEAHARSHDTQPPACQTCGHPLATHGTTGCAEIYRYPRPHLCHCTATPTSIITAALPLPGMPPAPPPRI